MSNQEILHHGMKINWGKTTFLKCLCGIRKCKGDLVIDGKPLDWKQRRMKMFMIMQDVSHQLFTDSVLEEVRLGMEEDWDNALTILKKLDLRMVEERHPLSLSGGQMQRVAIASAIAEDNDIILLDEPTSGLDYKHMMDISEILKELQSMGKTIIVATHDGEFIESCCSRKLIIWIIKKGISIFSDKHDIKKIAPSTKMISDFTMPESVT